MDVPVITASEPTPTQSNRSEPSGLYFYAVYFALGIFLYALSPGPVAKYLRLGKGPPPAAYLAVYAPLMLFYREFPAVQRFYDWYFNDVWHVG
jgi:hypothetical protein